MQISPLTPPKLLNLLQDKFWRVMTRSQLLSMNTGQRIQAAETKVSTGLPSLTSIPFISTLCSIYKLYCSYLTMYRKHTTSIFKTNKTSSSLSDILTYTKCVRKSCRCWFENKVDTKCSLLSPSLNSGTVVGCATEGLQRLRIVPHHHLIKGFKGWIINLTMPR